MVYKSVEGQILEYARYLKVMKNEQSVESIINWEWLQIASILIFTVAFWWIIGKGAGTSWGNNFW